MLEALVCWDCVVLSISAYFADGGLCGDGFASGVVFVPRDSCIRGPVGNQAEHAIQYFSSEPEFSDQNHQRLAQVPPTGACPA